MNTILFKKNESVKEITIDQLKQTQSLQEYSGNLKKTAPIEHYQFIEKIMEKMEKNNLHPNLDPIYVSRSDSKRIGVLDPDKTGILSSWLFQRLVGRIQLNGQLSNSKHNVALAFGYNIRGLHVAWGTNVQVCQNMSIFGDNYMSTYGEDAMPSFDKLLENIDHWINIAREKWEYDNKILECMKDKRVNNIQELVGKLQMAAVANAYIDSKVIAPLNIGQVSTFSKNIITKHPDKANANNISLYEIFNTGTEILKPYTTDITNVWKNTQDLGNFIIKEYNLN